MVVATGKKRVGMIGVCEVFSVSSYMFVKVCGYEHVSQEKVHSLQLVSHLY
jgi:hypothetical protein